MKRKIRDYSLFVFSTFLVVFQVQAQKLQNPASKASLEIDGKKLSGYSVRLDFTSKEIFKGWWKYSKEFSRNETKKEQIKHTIPPKEGESTVPIIFYSKVSSPDSVTSTVTAALSDTGMSSDNITKYDKQIKSLLENFRTEYYQNNLQRKISDTERTAAKIGRQLDRYHTEGIRLEQKLVTTRDEKAAHEQAIIENDSLIITLTRDIELNRAYQDSVNMELDKVKSSLEELREMIKGIR